MLDLIVVIPLVTLQLNNGSIYFVSPYGDSMQNATLNYSEIQRYQLENSVSADEVIRQIQSKLKEQNALSTVTPKRK